MSATDPETQAGAEGITRPGPSREATAAGIEVAHAWAEQDRLDPHRPTLGQLVAAVVDRRVTGRRATDGADRDALLDLLGAVERYSAGQAQVDAVLAAAARARRHVDREPAR